MWRSLSCLKQRIRQTRRPAHAITTIRQVTSASQLQALAALRCHTGYRR